MMHKSAYLIGCLAALATVELLHPVSPALAVAATLMLATSPYWFRSINLLLEALTRFSKRDRWTAIARALWATRWFANSTVSEPGGGVPRLLHHEPHRLGWKLHIQSGVPIATYQRNAENLAIMLGARRLEFEAGEKVGAITITGVVRDVLNATRESSPPLRATSTDMRVTIGRTEIDELVIDLAEPSHIAIQGMSRHGKTNLAPQIVAFAVKHPHIRVTGVDPSRVLLDGIAGSVVGTADMHQAAALLESLVAEMDGRIDSFLRRGVDKLTAFSEEQPLVVVVLEEAPGLVTAATGISKALAERIQRAVARLTQEGLKAGFRIVALAQRFDAAIFGGEVRANFGTRLTLRVDAPQAVAMLHPLASEELIRWILGAPPGVGIVDLPGNPTRRFRGDQLRFATYRDAIGAPTPPEVTP